jgi:hypothetical protein
MSDNLPMRTEPDALALRFPILDPNSADEIRQIIEANIGPRGLKPQQFASKYRAAAPRCGWYRRSTAKKRSRR